MLNYKTTFSVTVLFAGATLTVASACLPTDVHAATSSTVVPPVQTMPTIPPVATPTFPSRRAPLAPPAINDVSRAYEFRTQLLGSPHCQRFATESDNVFLNGALDDTQKADMLKALGAEAKASGCLTPSAY